MHAQGGAVARGGSVCCTGSGRVRVHTCVHECMLVACGVCVRTRETYSSSGAAYSTMPFFLAAFSVPANACVYVCARVHMPKEVR